MKRYLPVAGVFVLLLAWFLASVLEATSPLILPSPSEVVKSFCRIFLFQRDVLPDLGVTVVRTLVSFALSCAIGIPIGLAMGYVPSIGASLEFIVDFFRSIPPIALFPLFLTVLGLGEASRIGVPVYGCTLVIIVNSAYGVVNAPPIRRTMAGVFGFSRARIFTRIVFPDALPHVFTGMRIALSLALVLTVVVEMTIGSENGIGRRIYDFHLLFRTPEMYSTIIAAGALGYALNKGFVVVERRIVHWGGR